MLIHARSEIAGHVVRKLPAGALPDLVHHHEGLAAAEALSRLPAYAEVTATLTRPYELAGDPDGVGVEVELTYTTNPPG